MINGVITKKLNKISDERGFLMECLRSDDPNFMEFGQAYITTAYPGVTKAWHFHKEQTDFFVPIRGMFKVVLFDDRDDSSTSNDIDEFFIGDQNPILIKIPPLVCHGFKCIGEEMGIILNIPTKLYNYAEPDEHRLDPHDSYIPYSWDRTDG